MLWTTRMKNPWDAAPINNLEHTNILLTKQNNSLSHKDIYLSQHECRSAEAQQHHELYTHTYAHTLPDTCIHFRYTYWKIITLPTRSSTQPHLKIKHQPPALLICLNSKSEQVYHLISSSAHIMLVEIKNIILLTANNGRR